ncbi:PucR family transcriptional regulator [Candidatus Enterococcus clewellii]|uniref:Purine catabolism regulatory protein n=1 Tax=Candidatus Enterococcus clewellii TaxID=1834193 RepID=A0A242K2D1_9ENTE|nr:PucR family transcriptional regulator [Enterococcus sp. 9E7_DIV0242]OTP11622.1 hypothetical protein A5888_003721 [Enterococcus sp. 9E7_DIV0242]
MGVKLNELLRLPSLREAEVVTGKNSLEKSVTSLSFLEVSDMDFFSKNIQVGEEYYAGELLIGSFYSIKDDRMKQCEAIRHLHDLGEIGIILYYVGIILPELAPEVIELAEELNFVIIQMPPNDSSLRYNEVIIEIMSVILANDPSENILNEVLEKVSLLPEHLRSVEITLKILSDLLRTNIVLANADYEIINQIKWPRNSSRELPILLNSYLEQPKREAVFYTEELAIYHREVFHKDNGLLNLFLLKENGEITDFDCEQAVELLQVALNLWGRKHGEISEYALVQAIINDESEKMYRLAGILSIDVHSIQMLWLIQLKNIRMEKSIREELADHVSKYYQTYVIQFIDNGIVVLLGKYRRNHSEFEISREFLKETSFNNELKNIVVCPKMRNTTDVRNTYQLVNNVRPMLKRVFPEKKTFSLIDIKQASQVMAVMKAGEQELSEHLLILDPILENDEYLETLCCFLLDADGDFQHCSDLLYIHKNTVKYRIKKISEQLGCDVTRLSEAYECYKACVLFRLIHQ